MVVAGSGRGVQRVTRAAVLAGASVALGALAHAATGACVPAAAAVAAGVVMFGATWVLAAAEAGGGTLLGWIALTQLFVHLVLTLGCTDGLGAAVHHSTSGWTLAGHVVAVIATAAALRMAEAGVWTAARARAGARWLFQRLSRVAVGAQLVSPQRPVDLPSYDDLAWVRLLAPVLGTCGRRGPPAALLAA